MSICWSISWATAVYGTFKQNIYEDETRPCLINYVLLPVLCFSSGHNRCSGLCYTEQTHTQLSQPSFLFLVPRKICIFCLCFLASLWLYQFSSVAQSCLTLYDPMNRSMPGLPVRQQLLEFTRTMSIESVMPSNHLILCRPLLLLPPIPSSIRVFSNESALPIRRSKYWSFSFSISPFH